jgi:hypothetical protein
MDDLSVEILLDVGTVEALNQKYFLGFEALSLGGFSARQSLEEQHWLS